MNDVLQKIGNAIDENGVKFSVSFDLKSTLLLGGALFVALCLVAILYKRVF